MGRNDRYKDIQLPQLRSFCVAAAEGSFTVAARRLGLSTPTVWQQVRALEQQLRTTLMRRHGRSVELTDEGRLLLEIVQPHVNGLDSLESRFAARQRNLPPELTAAATPYLASSHLLKPVRAYTKKNPSVRLKLRVFVWFKQVVQLVEQGQADVGVIFHSRKDPQSSQIDYEYLLDLPFSLITPLHHPLARKRIITPADWAKYPLIVPPEGAYARRTLDQLLERHDLRDRVRIVMETPLLDSIRQYVAAGLGIALMHIGQQNFPGIRLHVHPLTDEEDSICVAAITRRGARLSPPVEGFRQILRQFLSGSVAVPEN
jgi:DNA-binding transcriptional LysR family regulator